MGLKGCWSWELERVSWNDRRGWPSSSMLETEVMGRGGGAGNEHDRSAAVTASVERPHDGVPNQQPAIEPSHSHRPGQHLIATKNCPAGLSNVPDSHTMREKRVVLSH